MRLCMLLKLHDPRRSHVAPRNLTNIAQIFQVERNSLVAEITDEFGANSYVS